MKSINKITYVTSEHVSPSHPDKVMDTLAEKMLWEVKQQVGAGARFAMDGLIKNNKVWFGGEVSGWNDELKEVLTQVTHNTLNRLGYGREYCDTFFGGAPFEVNFEVTAQSQDIAKGVDRYGAGDNGIMYGYASDETPDYTFAPHYVAKRLLRYLYKAWQEGSKEGLRPDMKALVTMRYVCGVPDAITRVVVCVSHNRHLNFADLKEFIQYRLEQISNITGFDVSETYVEINPTGSFTLYGPVADSGLVGRKIVVDQYGGALGCPVGGGNLNGKDATKVDRSGVYMARFIAKNIVAAGLASKVVVQLSYAIGRPEAVSLNVEAEGVKLFRKNSIRDFVELFDTSVAGIIESFDLNHLSKEVHNTCGMWGHIGEFGYSGVPLFPWEQVSF